MKTTNTVTNWIKIGLIACALALAGCAVNSELTGVNSNAGSDIIAKAEAPLYVTETVSCNIDYQEGYTKNGSQSWKTDLSQYNNRSVSRTVGNKEYSGTISRTGMNRTLVSVTDNPYVHIEYYRITALIYSGYIPFIRYITVIIPDYIYATTTTTGNWQKVYYKVNGQTYETQIPQSTSITKTVNGVTYSGTVPRISLSFGPITITDNPYVHVESATYTAVYAGNIPKQ